MARSSPGVRNARTDQAEYPDRRTGGRERSDLSRSIGVARCSARPAPSAARTSISWRRDAVSAEQQVDDVAQATMRARRTLSDRRPPARDGHNQTAIAGRCDNNHVGEDSRNRLALGVGMIPSPRRSKHSRRTSVERLRPRHDTGAEAPNKVEPTAGCGIGDSCSRGSLLKIRSAVFSETQTSGVAAQTSSR